MKLFRTVLFVLAVATLTATVGNFKLATTGRGEATPGISFSLRIFGQELVGFSFQDSRATTSWITEHEEK